MLDYIVNYLSAGYCLWCGVKSFANAAENKSKLELKLKNFADGSKLHTALEIGADKEQYHKSLEKTQQWGLVGYLLCAYFLFYNYIFGFSIGNCWWPIQYSAQIVSLTFIWYAVTQVKKNAHCLPTIIAFIKKKKDNLLNNQVKPKVSAYVEKLVHFIPNSIVSTINSFLEGLSSDGKDEKKTL